MSFTPSHNAKKGEKLPFLETQLLSLRLPQVTTLIYPNSYSIKGKTNPITSHEGPLVEKRYSSTLSLTSTLYGWVVNATPWSLYPRERLGTHCTGGGVGPRANLDGNLSPTGIRPPNRPVRSESLYRLSYPGPLILCAKFLQNPTIVTYF